MKLIIVESPTKAKTFNRILKGKDYFVVASMGHIRDLPKSKFGIDVKNNFQPDYMIIKGKEKIVSSLKKNSRQKDEIILATDLDREGESIAYHIAYILGMIDEKWPDFSFKKTSANIKRIVFHEITEEALKKALQHPEKIRKNLVKAQQTRRILDRLVGYKLSPLLWKKMGKFWLSAGRVQTVALRFIVEREKEIRKFKGEGYYKIGALFKKDKDEIEARLVKKNNQGYEKTVKLDLFAGQYIYKKTLINEVQYNQIAKDLKSDSFWISEIKETTSKRTPPPPLTTSLLQQKAFNLFSYSSKMTMKIAQDLYEAGLITYHRTDSFNLSESFLIKTKKYIKKKFGDRYLLDKARYYKVKSKNAQEAHEAIRPTDPTREPEKIKLGGKISFRHLKLYKLIFKRAIASQMKEAQIKNTRVVIRSDKKYLFRSSWQKIIFNGYLAVLGQKTTDQKEMNSDWKKNDHLDLKKLIGERKVVPPPPRYNEASLIKVLEDKGIGRPSTYSPIVSLIQTKGYIEKQASHLIPSLLGEKISDYLSNSFPKIFDINFTAKMENDLDLVAANGLSGVDLLTNFYRPFVKRLEKQKKEKKVINIEEKTGEKCPKCGSPLVIRYSRYGKFYACSAFPKCKFTKPFLKYVDKRFCPDCGGRVVIRFTKKRKRFYGCENYPQCQFKSWRLPAEHNSSGKLKK